MTNFDFLKTEKKFDSFSDVAITAEKLLNIDIDSCVMNCRRAMEFAVKWMYSVDKDLKLPYQDNLAALMASEDFKGIVGDDIWRRIDFIRKVGNNTAHRGKKITREQSELCLENLYYFLDQAAYFYADNYTERPFDQTLRAQTSPAAPSAVPDDIDINALKHEIEQALNANISDENRYTDALDAAVKKLNTYYIDAHSVMKNMPQITAIKNILI